jgi:hypothetical protein
MNILGEFNIVSTLVNEIIAIKVIKLEVVIPFVMKTHKYQ